MVASALERFAPLQKEADDFVARHKEIVEQVLQANESFTRARIDEAEHKPKEDYFKELTEATHKYMKLSKQVVEGMGFFVSCKQRLNELHERMSDLAAARVVEREELAARLADRD